MLVNAVDRFADRVVDNMLYDWIERPNGEDECHLRMSRWPKWFDDLVTRKIKEIGQQAKEGLNQP